MTDEKPKLTPFRAALCVFVVASATILGAWAFQAAGYAPCDLCLKQRIAYYVGIPVAALTMAVASRADWRGAARFGLAALALIFAASALFGAYHSGVEWGFWPGPADCTGTLEEAGSMGNFMKQLQTTKVVRCDAVAIRILGLSLAGWNALISAAIAIVAAIGASRSARPHR
ncbi:MAG: disulfide bond formation protein B [Beijerinckiaceae bacterium]